MRLEAVGVGRRRGCGRSRRPCGRRCAAGCACCRPSCRGRRVRCSMRDLGCVHGRRCGGRVRRAGGAASAGSGTPLSVARPSAIRRPLMTTGLDAWVNASSTTGSSMAVQAVEQELRVEAGGDVLALDGRLDRLRGLRLVAGAGVEGEHAVAEGQLDRGVALGDQRDALDRLDQRGLVDRAPWSGARWGTGCGPWGTRRRAAGSSYGVRRRGRRPRSR